MSAQPSSEFFGSLLLRSERSRAFGKFCERVYGRNLSQYGTADLKQLHRLIEVLRLGEDTHALDVGCGLGAQDEYISDLSRARITGIDAASPAVERAQERTRDKAHRLNFLVGDLNRLDFPPAAFDRVISIDTLYFASDLAATIGQMKAVLKSQGEMGLFFTQILTPEDGPERLQADQTNLARALKANDLRFQTDDLTRSNRQFWQRSKQIAEELRAEFEAEGNLELCEARIGESRAVSEMISAGKVSRYLYHVTLQ